MKYYTLTTPQENIWNLQKYYENTAIANLCGVVFYHEKHDVELLQKAINYVLRKQTALRLHFVRKEGKIKQYVKEYAYVDIPIKKFLNEEECDKYAKEIATNPMGLLECDMYRIEIVSIGEKQGILAVLSHLVSDAWTFSLIINEVDDIYKKLLLRKEINEECVDYIDFIQSEEKYYNSVKFKKDEEYWQRKYSFKPEKSSMKNGSITKESITAKRLIRKIPINLTRKIKCYSVEKAITPAVIFESALNLYLYRINPENRAITIGIPILNRTKVTEKKTAGMFISTLPKTIEISDEDTVRNLTDKITDANIQLFRHEKYPYSMILKKLREKQNFEGNLYDVMFSFQNAQTNIESTTRWYSNGYSEIPFVLHVDNRDNSDTYTLTVDYQVSLFKEEKEVNDIIDRLEYILEQIIENDGAKVSDISIVPNDEKKRILFEFNDTKVDYPESKCVHEMFMEQTQKTPDATAVVFEEKEITYRQLDEMSNILAHLLRDKGVGRGDIVPIIAKQSWQILVAMLGILKAGAGYMPIDPDYPKDRVQFIINEAKSRVGCALRYDEQLDEIELLELNELSMESVEVEKKYPVENQNEAGDVCYVIFTSGSTGVPKGVMISHGNLYNYIMSVITKYKIRSFNMSLITNIYVDFSITAIFLPLVTGAMVEVIDQDLKDGLQDILTKKNDVYKLTPTHLEFLRNMKLSLPDDLSFIVGGEALRKRDIEYICRNNRLLDEYGPTEATVGCCVKIYEKGNVDVDMTIGKPIANTQIYILDKHKNVVPIGIPGELCIAGNGVGIGYLNRPDLTAERFVENPFATQENRHGKVMYRTGDLAAWRENGEIEYLGRIDTQVKIRGLRVELGEIESVMSEFPGIRMCAVTDKKDEEGRQYLVGYYTTVSAEKENSNIIVDVPVNEKELRKYLLSKLPKHMVPNYFMHLFEIPVATSGKTDRKSLPLPEKKMGELCEYVAPTTEQEAILCSIMEEVLDYRPIGVTHDFFSCGGDSLKAMEFQVFTEDKGIKLKLQDIFDYPTVAELVGAMQKKEYNDKKFLECEINFAKLKKYESILELNKLSDDYDMKEISIRSVLLSGITGFLGAHIADALLQDEKCVVYCLIRNKEPNDRRSLSQILEYYFGNRYSDLIGKRIIPVVGDITNKKLSDELPEKVDMVIHAAATVKHYGSYEFFYEVNNLGTKHMVDYALRTGARFIHISTTSVSGKGLSDDFEPEKSLEERYFSENCLYQGQSLYNVYVRSKFEAECVVFDAILQGLQANIIRVGNLTNRSRDYVFQPNYTENAFLSRIKAILEFGYLPEYILPLYSEFSPVDDAADAIVRIAKHFNMQYTVFHVYSNRKLYFDRLLQILKELSVSMKVIEGETFFKRLKETVSQNRVDIYEAFLNDVDTNGKLNYETNVHIQNDFTISYLKQLGFEWTKIDYEYIKGYVEYYRKIGYLEVGKNEN